MQRLLALAAFAAAGLAALPAGAGTRLLQVPAATLYPGDPVQPAQLAPRSFTGSDRMLAGYVERPDQAAGKFARRTLPAGRPILLSAIKGADAVFEGQPAMATLVSGNLTITALLVPLESAAAGDTLRARNPDSGLTVTAIARGDGTLLVAAP